MKKLILIGAFALVLSSCASINKSSIATTSVRTPIIETVSFASLEVSPERISYTYAPTQANAKGVGVDVLTNNAIYMALAANGNADVLVKVNTFITYHKGLVKSIMVSGYPAYYVDFREPTEDDLKTLYEISRSEAVRNANASAEESLEKGGLVKGLFKR